MKVYIVYGAPASGKSTYVKEHMKVGDLVVDFDLIKMAIALSDKAESIGKLYDVAEGIREYLYGLIERRTVICDTVWVIASLAKAEERNALVHRLGGTLIYIRASEQQCISRAIKDGTRKDKELQIKIIRKWFDSYKEDALYTEERWD